MKQLRIVALWFALPVSSLAQGTDDRYSGNLHGFGVLGACQHGYGVFGAGGGAEGFLWKGITLGVDGGYYRFTDGWTFGLVSGQAGYHFTNRTKRQRWDPFVTVGVGAVLSGGIGPSGNLGGGVNYWTGSRWGVRMEFRVHGFTEEAVFAGRIGVTFR